MRNFFVGNIYFRIVLMLLVVLMLMFFCIIRVVKIIDDSYEETALSINGYTLEIGDSRGNILDANGKKITGERIIYHNVFIPCDTAILKYAQLTEGEEREEGLKKLRDKKPVILKSEKIIEGEGVYSYKSFERYSNTLGLEHIIGYLNGEGDGASGLERTYNDILKSEKATELFFETTASGDFLLGAEPIVNEQNSKGNLYLTIDKDIQLICNNAAKDIKKGAIIVIENKTGKIRGMVSKPSFDLYNLAASINDEASPFLNRALCAYSVGSVFKPLVAAAMLETSKESFVYECNGYSDILGIRFYCNNHNGHGEMDLNGALTNSCNTYFYNAAALGNPKIFTDLCASLGFGRKMELADEIYAIDGTITSLEELKKSKANIANFAIGQGNIALSPLVLCNLYSAIANNGYYFAPQLIEGYTENGKYIKTKSSAKAVVFSKNTAVQLRRYLINAVNFGTGVNAKPISGEAGGKTATAQTGRFKENKEILNAWFCGFFPAREPEYVIVVLLEDADSGGRDSAPIFKKIAEDIAEIS